MASWEQIEGQWNKLKLTEEEKDPISVEDDLSEDECIKERRSIIGKLCMNRIINKDVLRITMGRIWRTSKPALYKEVGKNLLNISFAMETDKHRVIAVGLGFFIAICLS